MFSRISRQVKNLGHQLSSKYHGSELWKPAVTISGAEYTLCRYELDYCKKVWNHVSKRNFKTVSKYWFGPKKIL